MSSANPVQQLARSLPRAFTTIEESQPVHIVGARAPMPMTVPAEVLRGDSLFPQAIGNVGKVQYQIPKTSSIPLRMMPKPPLPPTEGVKPKATFNGTGSVKLISSFLSGKVPLQYLG